MVKLKVVFDAFTETGSDRRLRNRWMTDEVWYRCMERLFPDLISLGVTRATMNNAISRCTSRQVELFDASSNTTGIFSVSFQMEDPFADLDNNGNRKRRKTTLYYFADPGEVPERPATGNPAWQSMTQEFDEFTTRVRAAQRGTDSYSRINAVIQEAYQEAHREPSNEEKEEEKQQDPLPVEEQDYFDSPEAKRLFIGDSKSSMSVRDVLEARIALLQRVNKRAEGWREIVENYDKDNLCTPHDIYAVRQRSQLLCLAYIYAVQHMNKWNWNDCCQKACKALREQGVEASSKSLQAWNRLLRSNRDRFRMSVHSKEKSLLPELFEYFSSAKDDWISYCISNLADLTHEMARNELNNVIVPKLFQEQLGKFSTTHDIILNRYKNKPISETTAWRWLRRLGFRYDNRKKSFYVDGHERPDVVLDRNQFTTNYLTQLEPRCFRWIQFTVEEVNAMKAKRPDEDRFIDPSDERGYRYTHNGIEMIEYHVDDYEFLHDIANERRYPFGGNLSVRKPADCRPLILIGQDESVFSQYLMGGRQWVGPAGQRALLPKTD